MHRRTLTHSQQIVALAVIVNAKDEAQERFYWRCGFEQLVDRPRRLFYATADDYNVTGEA